MSRPPAGLLRTTPLWGTTSDEPGGGGTSAEGRAPLVVARDPEIVEQIQAAAAAAEIPVQLVRDPAAVRAAWRSAPVVLVSEEMAAMVAGMALEARLGVHLVGEDPSRLATWSSVLQAAVISLPAQGQMLTVVLCQGTSPRQEALVVHLVGGSGGLGVSTLACAMAQRASRRGIRAAVVELDPDGGGLDLVLGAEAAPGWRWRDLRSAAGHLDSLQGRLPNVSGVDVVSHTRPEAARTVGGTDSLPSAEAVRAVLGSLARTHRLVVLDAGRGVQGMDGWPGRRQVLVCGADVRGVLAARRRAARLGLHDVELVVRTGAARRLDPALVSETLGIPLLGSIGDDPAVTRAAETAVPVGLGRGRRGYAHQVDALLDGLAA